tara:strand:+ start:110 stop:448 length:339 start_codon:yes stop_codon:yes gene_type:complete
MTTISTPRLTKQTAQLLEILYSQLDHAKSNYSCSAELAKKFDTGEFTHNEDSCSVLSNQKMAFRDFEETRDQYFVLHWNLGEALHKMLPSLRKETKGDITKAVRIVRASMEA